MSNWRIGMQSLILGQNGSSDMVVARVNQNIVGWKKNVHILVNAEAMLETLEQIAELAGFEPNEPYGIKVLELIEKCRGRKKG